MERKKKYYEIAIIVFGLLLLIPVFIQCKYSRPIYDDYDYSQAVRNSMEAGTGILRGALISAKHFYMNWQGTYASAVLMALQPGIFGEKVYILSPILLLFYCIACIYLTIRLMGKCFFKISHLMTAAMTLVVMNVLMLLMPSINQAIYWHNSAMHYTTWSFLIPINLMLCLTVVSGAKKKETIIYTILCVGFSFLISGGNQVTAFANILLLLAITVYGMCKMKWQPILPLISAVVGFVVMFIAPGNSVRQATFEQPTVSETLEAVMNFVKEEVVTWASVQWLLALLALTPFLLMLAKELKVKVKGLTVLAVFFIFAATLCGMLSVPYKAMGDFGEIRVMNAVWTFFIFFSFVLYAMLIFMLTGKEAILSDKLAGQKTWWSMTIVTLLGLWLIYCTAQNGSYSNTKNLVEIQTDGSAKEYVRLIDERIEILNNPNFVTIEFHPLPDVPKTMMSYDYLSSDPEAWPNNSMGEYYKKKISVIR